MTPQQRGVALIMVILMIAISSAILVALTDSTYVAMRLNSAAEQRVKAEYILKSAINVAQTLIKNDNNDFDNPDTDLWLKFSDGMEIPGDLLGLQEANVRVSLLISSEGRKIPLMQLKSNSSTQVPTKWVEITARLFENLGFDQPSQPTQGSNKAPSKEFSSKELVANIIDYLDTDEDSANVPNFAQGMEGDLPKGQEFRNDNRIDSLASELSAIPGFTSDKIQRLLPFVSARSFSKININAAPPEVIKALDEDLDDAAADSIIQFRNPAGGGPFTANDLSAKLGDIVEGPAGQRLASLVQAEGNFFEIIAKVEYGTATFLASATLKKTGNGRMPKILSLQIY